MNNHGDFFETIINITRKNPTCVVYIVSDFYSRQLAVIFVTQTLSLTMIDCSSSTQNAAITRNSIKRQNTCSYGQYGAINISTNIKELHIKCNHPNICKF